MQDGRLTIFGCFCDFNLGLFYCLLIWVPVIGINSGLYLPLSPASLLELILLSKKKSKQPIYSFLSSPGLVCHL